MVTTDLAVAPRATTDEESSNIRRGQGPYPGSHVMPRWDLGPLVDAPLFRWRNWTSLVGPGLVMGAASIGGGEWLAGPLVTARYGGALLWLATISILSQVVYNLEISRYTLYSGEPIFTGKFRVPPGPLVWVWLYLLVDLGSFLPYLASSAATPLAMVILNDVPDLDDPSHRLMLKALGCGIFLMCVTPLIFGGKVYNSLRWVMSIKLIVVLGFLLLLAGMFSKGETWGEIFSGFVRFGSVPIAAQREADGTMVPGSNVDNVFTAIAEGRPLPKIDLTMIGAIALMVAISGSGGLTNSNISAYTREQGWGMGCQVGAIPSVVGGQNIKLSHVGCVFTPNAETLPRWRRWYRHVMREQLIVWMPACFFGLALPSMLSVQFLPRGTEAKGWTAAGMTAKGVGDAVEASFAGFGNFFWYLTLLCGFLVLSTSMITTADGAMRRWVDLVWTGLPALKKWDASRVRYLYFGVLCGFVTLGLFNLCFWDGGWLMDWAGNMYIYAFGISCWHVLAVNTLLLPRELRPNWFIRIALVSAGLFFITFAVITTLQLTHLLDVPSL